MKEESGDRLPEMTQAEEAESVASGLSRELRRLLMLLLAALAVFLLFYLTPLGSIASDIRQLRQHLAGGGGQAELGFLALAALLVALGLPRLMFYILGGLLFGFWLGLGLAQIAAVAGSLASFWAVRSGGRGWLLQRFGGHRLIGKAFRVKSTIPAVVLIRQLPLTSLMINTGLALSAVSVHAFLIGTFIGYLPQGIVATLIGSGLVSEHALGSLTQLATAGFGLLVLAGLLWSWRSSRAARGSGDYSE